MTTLISNAAGHDVFRSALRAAGRQLQALRGRWSARRTIATLQDLTDSQLRDIGLHRSEIRHLFHR